MAEEKNKTILIVEDDPSVIEFLKFALEKEGFSTNVVSDGTQVLKSVEKSIPDLILQDMMLPGRTGLEIVRSLQTGEYKQIPIIIMTAKFTGDSFRDMLKSEPNVKEYVTKPIKIEILFSTIHSILKTVPPEQKKVEGGRQKKEKEIDPWKINI